MKIALATSNKKTLCDKIGFCKYIMIFDTHTKDVEFIENPVYKKAIENGYKDCGEHGLGTGFLLPPLLKEKGVEIFFAKKMGEGLLGNLEANKIKAIFTNKSIEEIIKEY